eukprot:SM000314S12184  [mRNA]  locus=s314:20611:26618:+ [translate_table: standard]
MGRADGGGVAVARSKASRETEPTTVSCARRSSVDYGSEWLKVAVVNPRPGQSPITIAINEISKRKSPALVAYVRGEALASEEAAGMLVRYPDRVYARLRDLVGKPMPAAQALLNASYLPYELVRDEERGTCKIKTHDGEVLHPEELMAMLFNYVRTLAESHSKSIIKNVVITVPAYFGQSQRQAILDAAQIADINVMSLVNEHAGVALQYGIDKDFSNASRDIVVYDVGANSAYAAVLHFSAYAVKERGKPVTSNQFQVKAIRWDATLGGQTMEARLVEHFATEFNEKLGSGADVRSSPKAMAKLKKEVKRTKEILSANVDAPLSVEGLFEDRDFRTTISREKFEELCADLWPRALAPVKDVIADANLTMQDIHSIELIGGATRVPKLQQVLSQFVGDKGLARHLDADEAMALGASLVAANLSDGFKLNRKIGMVDGLPYAVHLQLENATDETITVGGGGPQLLFPRLKRLPTKIIKPLKGQSEDFVVRLQYDSNDALPPGIASEEIATYSITGVANATAKYSSYNLSQPIKLNMHLALTRSGLASLEKVEAVVEIQEWIEVPVLIKNETQPVNATIVANATEDGSSNITDTGSATAFDEEDSKDEEGAGETAGGLLQPMDMTASENETTVAPTVEMKRKLRKRTIRIPLTIKDLSSSEVRGLSVEAIQRGRERLEILRMKAASKRETEEAKNSLESYIFATLDKLEAGNENGVNKVSTEDQRNEFRAKMSEVEDWLYAEGDNANATEFRARLASLKGVGDQIFFWVEELTARPAGVEAFKGAAAEVRQTIDEMANTKPWINDTDKAKVLEEVEAAESWLTEKVKEQERTPLDKPPVFTSAEVLRKMGMLMEKTAKLSRIPKPRPKPSPKLDVNSTVGANSTNATLGGAEGMNATATGDEAAAAGAGATGRQGEQEEAAGSGAEAGHDEL